MQPLLDRLPEEAPTTAKEIVNSIGMKLMLIPKGTFFMGAPEERGGKPDDERPVHEVEIPQPFYLGVYQVTQAEYERVIGTNPSHFKSVKGQDTTPLPGGECVLGGRQGVLPKLSELPEEKRAGRLYRLPTEAEWEYACRGGA